MRILVTGGAGFIGSNYLHLLVPRHPEHQFINFDKLTYAANLMSLATAAACPNYKLVQGDIASVADVQAVFAAEKPDAVVHFAAESHVDRSIADPGAFIHTNIVGTFNLLEAARQLWGRGASQIFHHVSTDEVYGSLGPDGYFEETTRYDPSSPYSASKAASDHLVRAYARTYDMAIKLTNCSNNYGPRQFPEKLIPLMILNALGGKPLPVYGKGANVRDWLFVDDHVEALWAVLQRGRNGETYNVGGNSERTNMDVVKAICRGVAAATKKAPAELEALITFVPDRPGHDLRYAIDASKLKDELGWQPQETFDSGLQKTIAWYLTNTAWVDAVRTGEYRRWLELNYDQRKAVSS
jgi:dTDP-glucose 4,6-dehydratase